ncbi:trypsin-like serine peptidase [Comamonas guangdongensis]|uniref:Serine protease n=1 Tax=Comamonas guangdongensis TaxID=510515 RepID=A0ABV3ZUE9_9BURK
MDWWTRSRRIGRWCVSAVAAAVLAACGGGGGGSGGSGGGSSSGSTPKAYVLDSLVLPASAAKSAAALPAALRPTAATLVLPPWSEAKQALVAAPGTPLQIGVPRALAATQTADGLAQMLNWTQASDGGLVAAVSITSTGAYGLRLGLLVASLPDTARISLYRQDGSKTGYQTTGRAINAALARNRAVDGDTQAAGTWWSPDLGADEVTLEIELPAGVPASQLQIAIPTLAHAYVNLALPIEADLQAGAVTKTVGAAAACELDASCANQYATERNAVARMTYMGSDSRYYYCTGTLLNNTRLDYAPYFLSANHCVSTQASATSLRTDWFFRSASCNSTAPNPQTAARLQGAALLYATSVTDTSLMLLNETPPAGVTLAGWDARGTAAPGGAIYALHQPQGDYLKYSEGQIQRYDNCSLSGGGISCASGSAQSDFLSVVWNRGTTEGGSSGSALFIGGRVVGTLSGGSSSCTVAGGSDDYSRFDHAFGNKLKDWLAQ